ncbi:hypothetical protein [Kocuria palustris]|uniref:hypothetical protein n=1 Tax=Kocuria palustris TaxID=71999 RepID=UPI0011A338A4|nr:hypothetical protein [Kocuria palustris]
MARSSGGRPVRSSHPSWPPLRVRALLNGLVAVLAGVGLLWLTWGALDFTVYDASAVPAAVRIIALWLAVAMPIAWLAIGLHLIAAAALGGDRVLLAHGSAEWEPGPRDDVLRGIRIRRWRLGLTGQRRISARTLGWLPELSPYPLAPLAAGILVLLAMTAWMARGYGLGVIALLLAALWLGWRLLRGWQAWTDVHDLTGARTAEDRPLAEEDPTPDEAWDEPEAPVVVLPRDLREERRSSGIAATRPIDRAHEAADDPAAGPPLTVDDAEHRAARRRPAPEPEPEPDTAQLEVVAGDEPDAPARRGSRASSRAARARTRRGDRQPDEGPPEVLVDRSVQRAIRAKQAARERRRAEGEGAEASPGQGRGGSGRTRPGRRAPVQPRPQGMRAYLGRRTRQGQENSGTRALRESAQPPRTATHGGEEPFDQTGSQHRAGGGAPTAADAIDEIYGREDTAPSLLSYLSRRRDDGRC